MPELRREEEGEDSELLDRLVSLVRARRSEDDELIVEARRRAESLARAPAGDTKLAGFVLVADLLAAMALDRGWTSGDSESLLDQSAEILGLPAQGISAGILAAAVRSPSLVELPPRVGAEVQLRLLVSLAPVAEASLWVSRDGALDCVVHVGAASATRRVRKAAAETLANSGSVTRAGTLIHGVPVAHWKRASAALVVRVRSGTRDAALSLTGEVALALVPVVEKDELLERNDARERSLVQASERRLVRLGFDLHDGPLQDLAALLIDARLFREQIRRMQSLDERPRSTIVGRVGDFEARILTLQSELRELARSLESAALVNVPFVELIQREVDGLAASSIAVSLELGGRLDLLTPSQRIALLRVIQEALANVKEHSGATEAAVSVSSGHGYVRADVRDNGHGFDVEHTLVAAARAGHLGLVGMGERVRLLGGRMDVRSTRGGPTTISVTVPRWRPNESAAPGEAGPAPEPPPVGWSGSA